MKPMNWKNGLIGLVVFTGFVFWLVPQWFAEKEVESHRLVRPAHGWQKPLQSKAPKAKTQREPSQVRTLSFEESFSNSYPGKWNFLKNKKGHIHGISGGLIPIHTDIDMQKLAQDVAKFTQVPFDQLTGVENGTGSAMSKTSIFRQKVGPYPVYQSSVSILSRKSDGSAFLINNQLKPVGDVSLEPRLDSQQAQRSIASLSTGGSLSSKPELVVYAKNGQGELAWKFQVQSSQDSHYSHKDILVSAQDGRELYTQENAVHD